MNQLLIFLKKNISVRGNIYCVLALVQIHKALN